MPWNRKQSEDSEAKSSRWADRESESDEGQEISLGFFSRGKNEEFQRAGGNPFAEIATAVERVGEKGSARRRHETSLSVTSLSRHETSRCPLGAPCPLAGDEHELPGDAAEALDRVPGAAVDQRLQHPVAGEAPPPDPRGARPFRISRGVEMESVARGRKTSVVWIGFVGQIYFKTIQPRAAVQLRSVFQCSSVAQGREKNTDI